ncbi:MAG: D-alanyl-D-alanine carboxypeptidase [Verrucomicrobia bacterium]|nr:D-alanyl-D-alanine carboxypeptidase [Verrucomicrobiota bacterium]
MNWVALCAEANRIANRGIVVYSWAVRCLEGLRVVLPFASLLLLSFAAPGRLAASGVEKPVPRAELLRLSPSAPPAAAPVQPPASTLVLPARWLPFNTVAVDPPGAQGLRRYPLAGPDTVASSAMMIDARTGQVLYFKDPDVARPVASTQKLLTALVVAEHGDLDRYVRVSLEDCRVEPTKLGFIPGELYTRRQLLAAMLVHSCNDAAVCLARNDAGGVPQFAQRMNAKAEALGATQSHFVNPNGLPTPGQYSTARDMARIAFAAYHNSTLREFIRMPGFIFTYSSGRQRYLEATNKLLRRSAMFTGMKTGYTGASGRCLISSASNGGRELILVQLGGTHRMLFDDAQNLLLWGLEQRPSFVNAGY